MTGDPPPCSVGAYCPVNPSEDPDKILGLMTDLFDTEPRISATSASISSGSAECLRRICDSVASTRSRGACRRNLLKNSDGDSTWFYLNKQAAAAGRVALCAEADESPLGPVRVTIHSDRLDDVIDWMAPRDGGPRG